MRLGQGQSRGGRLGGVGEAMGGEWDRRDAFRRLLSFSYIARDMGAGGSPSGRKGLITSVMDSCSVGPLGLTAAEQQKDVSGLSRNKTPPSQKGKKKKRKGKR